MIASLVLLLVARADEPVCTTLRVVDGGTALALRDVDGDGDQDLLLIDGMGIHVRLLASDGTFAAEDTILHSWPAKNMAWMLIRGEDGRARLAAYVEGREVRMYALDRVDLEGSLELAFPGSLPRGRFEMRFFRDVDDDGRLDLVLPAFDSYAIHVRRPDGSFGEPIEVKLESDVDLSVGDPTALDSSFGQTVDVPWFSLEDVDGDGDVDLVAETEEDVRFHLAEPVLSTHPTWTLDLVALEAELPPGDEIDLSNLWAGVTRTVDWELRDLDGQVPRDLVVRVGSKLRVYLGAARTGPEKIQPQVMKASGNVLAFFLRNVEGDELPDLQILRGGAVSIATVLRLLVLPGSLDFDLFTYENQAGTFSRQPTRRNALSLAIPRLLAFAEEVEELEKRRDEEDDVPARRVALDADGVRDDVVDLVEGEILMYHGRASEEDETAAAPDGVKEAVEMLLFGELDDLEDGESKTFELRELVNTDVSPGRALREAVRDLEPDQRVAVETPASARTLHTRDLDGDGLPDLVLIGKDGAIGWTVQLVVRR